MSLPMKSGPECIADELIRPPARVNRRLSHLADRLWRGALRLAFLSARLWWFLRRPPHRGALVALWCGGRLLLVLSSYRRIWSLPGGGIGRNETARDAALRELREEVGLAVPASALRLAYEEEIFWEHRHDHVTIFEVELRSRPAIRLDGREIVQATFASPAEAEARRLAPHLRNYLRHKASAARPISQKRRAR